MEKELNSTMSFQTTKVKGAAAFKSTKEEKQRQNEEIVILESSSLSSETGSWESVFPTKLVEKELCQKFINNEQKYSDEVCRQERNIEMNVSEEPCTSLVQKSPFKSTSCFIDAASLADEGDDTNQIQRNTAQIQFEIEDLPASSQVACFTPKADISPNDWSEGNENEDSLEQIDKKVEDFVEKDSSPTLFEMTPITEDSICGNTFESALKEVEKTEKVSGLTEVPSTNFESVIPLLSDPLFVSCTPNNSIMSVKVPSLNQYESGDSKCNTNDSNPEIFPNVNKIEMKYNEASPIICGGAINSDYSPRMLSHTKSILSTGGNHENLTVSDARISQAEVSRFKPKPSGVSAWVVDMSTNSNYPEAEKNIANQGPDDTVCESLRNNCKLSIESVHSSENFNRSRSSVDSDNSEKSSHKFFIDLSSIPDAVPSKKTINDDQSGEKKNIFSMYIHLGEQSTLKEMPARLTSSIKTRKNSNDPKPKPSNTVCSESNNSFLSSMGPFEKYESLCDDPNINLSDIISISKSESEKSESYKKGPTELDVDLQEKRPKDRSRKIQNETQNKIPQKLDRQSDAFVKLSDLDRPVQKVDTLVDKHKEKVIDIRMTRSIPENIWDRIEPSSSRSVEVISSFHSENTLSLSRLFPHLKNEFSRSMPGSLSTRTRSPVRMGATKSPGNLDDQASIISGISSVQSSVCRSAVVSDQSTTEEISQISSLINHCQFRLGQDLLRMFLEEIAPDVIVEVSGRRIKAHKCILSSRCQYFAGILSGGWVESAGNVIVMPPFSFNVVHFALCHIYSGVSVIPDSISIVELATLADMLGLEGLKEVIMFTLKAKYCHHFHQPCPLCTAGVLECFPLSSVYGLDDLYRKCLKWITKYFSKVWPTKAFATLPKELLDKCYQQHVINMTTENFVNTVYGCAITVASLQNSRWAESVARMCQRLQIASSLFAASKLTAVLQTLTKESHDAPPHAKQALNECLSAAIEWAPPDEACQAYGFLSALIKELRAHNYLKPDLININRIDQKKAIGLNDPLFTDVSSWRMQCENALVRSGPRIVSTDAFKNLPLDLKNKLRELGCIMYGAQCGTAPVQQRGVRSTNYKQIKEHGSPALRSLDIDQVRASCLPYSTKATDALGSIDSIKYNIDTRNNKAKGLNQPKIRTTKAQEERTKFNLSKTKVPKDRLDVKNNARMSFVNTKPRYLDAKILGEKNLNAGKRLVPKMISSSESSRNSSPVQDRHLRTSRIKLRQNEDTRPPQAISQDSLATSSRPRTAEPSTDSLSESQNSNKYATYTKVKHTTRGSSECITASKYSVSNKLKTKIPIYVNHGPKSNCIDKKQENQRITEASKTVTNTSATTSQTRSKVGERKMPASLMSATKSSSAKMVTKAEPIASKNNNRRTKKTVKAANQRVEPEKLPLIPVMERSGTFLKDEPTFGDKTTNIDIGE